VHEYRTETEQETIALGERLAAELPSRGVVLLIGNLGAGKTTLAKGLVKGLTGVSTDDVLSPTFTLIHEYGDPVKVYHIDLYRLDTPEEVAAIGVLELFEEGLCLVEWGEKFPQLLPERRIEIKIATDPLEIRRISTTHL
jgi:tRNA threonylcarbamoyladenosine biosynthesis protein TsaE